MNELVSEYRVKAGVDNTLVQIDSSPLAPRVAIPPYLQKVYWWAYVHPRAVRVFERGWLVNLILFGNYRMLRDAALDEFGWFAGGSSLQVACVYGDLTMRLRERISDEGKLDVIDVLPIQLQNLRNKLPADTDVRMIQNNSASLGFADASYDRVLVFFLLHEQPESVRRSTLAEACRVVKPGGKVVIVDYHKPSKWNLLRRPLQALLRRLEPYADDLWQNELETFLPAGLEFASMRKVTYFGGLYQKMVLVR